MQSYIHREAMNIQASQPCPEQYSPLGESASLF